METPTTGLSQRELADLVEFQMAGLHTLSCSCVLIYRSSKDFGMEDFNDFEVDAAKCTRQHRHTYGLYMLNQNGRRYLLHLLRRDREIQAKVK